MQEETSAVLTRERQCGDIRALGQKAPRLFGYLTYMKGDQLSEPLFCPTAWTRVVGMTELQFVESAVDRGRIILAEDFWQIRQTHNRVILFPISLSEKIIRWPLHAPRNYGFFSLCAKCCSHTLARLLCYDIFMQIELKCGDRTIRATETRRGSFESQHSHKNLGLIDVTLVTQTEEQKDWAVEYGGKNGIVEAEGKRWRIEEPSYSYQDGSPITRFNWKLREVEDWHVTQLLLDGWELTPYKYQEQFDNGVLIAQARVELTADEYEKLFEMPTYFSVVRKGIDDKPREMRFGRPLWSQSGGKYRVQLYLIEKKYDDNQPRHGLFEPQASNDARRIVHSAILLDRLIDSLVAKSVLSAEEAEKIRDINDELKFKLEVAKRNRVDDLDKWLDEES